VKIVVGVLLVVNLLLFYWVMQQSNQDDALSLEVSTNMPPLRLLNEVTPQQEIKSSEVAQATESVDSPKSQATSKISDNKSALRAVFLELSCYSLGPFEEKESAKSASLTLTELGLVTTYKSETRRVINGYWVYIPPLPNRSDALKVISMLKQRGIKDYLIVSNGVKRNAISLGFFGTRDGAEQHQTQMKALGLNPLLEESLQESSGYWLDFSSPNNPPLPETVIEALHNQYDEISMKKRPCLK